MTPTFNPNKSSLSIYTLSSFRDANSSVRRVGSPTTCCCFSVVAAFFSWQPSFFSNVVSEQFPPCWALSFITVSVVTQWILLALFPPESPSGLCCWSGIDMSCSYQSRFMSFASWQLCSPKVGRLVGRSVLGIFCYFHISDFQGHWKHLQVRVTWRPLANQKCGPQVNCIEFFFW